MLGEMVRMSCEDGLVMTVHPGVRRNHHTPTLKTFGPDTGGDIPLPVEFTHLVLFTVDETVFSREGAPLAGVYPSVYAGAPGWFLDATDAIRRFRLAELVVEHRLDEDEALETAVELVDGNPRKVFKL